MRHDSEIGISLQVVVRTISCNSWFHLQLFHTSLPVKYKRQHNILVPLCGFFQNWMPLWFTNLFKNLLEIHMKFIKIFNYQTFCFEETRFICEPLSRFQIEDNFISRSCKNSCKFKLFCLWGFCYTLILTRNLISDQCNYLFFCQSNMHNYL